MTELKKQTRVELPGFGLPRSYGTDECFPHVLLDESGRGRLSKGVTLRERRMLDFIGTITDKPDWDHKVFDETIVGKWRQEATDMPRVADNDVYMSEVMFDNVRRLARACRYDRNSDR